MVKDKQLAPNRANARKSPGPRLDKGQRRPSQNALQQGVLAKAILFDGDDEQSSPRPAKPIAGNRAALAVRALNENSAHVGRLRRPRKTRKMNLNKRTHFDEASKRLIAPDPISKPILGIQKAA